MFVIEGEIYLWGRLEKRSLEFWNRKKLWEKKGRKSWYKFDSQSLKKRIILWIFFDSTLNYNYCEDRFPLWNKYHF